MAFKSHLKSNPILLLLTAIFIALAALSIYIQLQHSKTIDLHHYKAAIYTGVQSFESNLVSGGHILLITNEGEVDTIKHGKMDAGDIIWNSNGLFFSDNSFDYSITDKIKKTRSSKTDHLTSLLTISDNSIIGIYNKGFNNNEYHHEMINHTTKSDIYIFNKYIQSASVCDNQIYAITLYESNDQDKQHAHLYRIFDGKVFTDEAILKPTQFLPEANPFKGVHPCINNRIVTISNYSTIDSSLDPILQQSRSPENRNQEHLPNFLSKEPHGYSINLIETWDITTKQRTFTPLKFEDHTFRPTLNDNTQSAYLTHDSESVSWIYKDGSIFNTNINTGNTAKISESIFPVKNTNYQIEVTDSGKTIGILLVDYSSLDQNTHIIQLDKQSLKPVQAIKLNTFSDKIGDGEVLRGFSLNPNA